MYLVILLYALFAAVFTIGKAGLEFAQPFFLVGSRMLLAGLLMLAYQILFRRKSFFAFFASNKSTLWKVVRLALFNIYLTNVFEFWGLKYLTSYKTCFIYSLSPFFSALFSYFFMSEKMSMRKWVGLIVGSVGFLPILLNETSSEELTGQLFFFSWAEIAVMAAALSAVYGWILLKQLVKENECSPFMVNGLSMTIGGVFALIHSLLVEDWNPIPVNQMQPFLECTFALILISNLICYNLYGFLLRRFSATFISFAGFITPLFSAFFGWYYLSELITWPFYLSALIVFLGLFTFYQEELKQEEYAVT
jgi:drug/metabolite transporter (DMT)-like permease